MAAIERRDFAPVTPAVAQRLWTDTTRWRSFVDGFAQLVEQDPGWPQPGSRAVWQSNPAGRGRVAETIETNDEGVVAIRSDDAQMSALQTARFEPADHGCEIRLTLDYQLRSGGPLRWVTDVLFIRRALAMALERTLEGFSTEAAEEATL